ncbi:MAG: hypothetical protein RRY07_02515, partial [Bacteroidaceae bacterium]
MQAERNEARFKLPKRSQSYGKNVQAERNLYEIEKIPPPKGVSCYRGAEHKPKTVCNAFVVKGCRLFKKLLLTRFSRRTTV